MFLIAREQLAVVKQLDPLLSPSQTPLPGGKGLGFPLYRQAHVKRKSNSLIQLTFSRQPDSIFLFSTWPQPDRGNFDS